MLSQLYTYAMHARLVLSVMVCHDVYHVLSLCSVVVHHYTFHYTGIFLLHPPPLTPVISILHLFCTPRHYYGLV